MRNPPTPALLYDRPLPLCMTISGGYPYRLTTVLCSAHGIRAGYYVYWGCLPPFERVLVLGPSASFLCLSQRVAVLRPQTSTTLGRVAKSCEAK